MFPLYNEIDTCSRWICVGQYGPASFLSCAGLTYAFLRCWLSVIFRARAGL